jgi:hypothetical protein
VPFSVDPRLIDSTFSHLHIKAALAGVARPAQQPADTRTMGVLPAELAEREPAGAWHFDIAPASGLSTGPPSKVARYGESRRKEIHWAFVRRQQVGRSETQPKDKPDLEVFDVDGWLAALGPQASAVDMAWVDKVKERLRSISTLPLLTLAQAAVALTKAYPNCLLVSSSIRVALPRSATFTFLRAFLQL